MKKLAIAALVAFIATTGAQAAGDAAAGQTKAAICAACHGMDGNSPANPVWPKLAGQHPTYIQKQIADFKSGARKDPTMTAMATPLSDQDAADLAAYFSGQALAVGSANAEKAALGKKIYQAGLADKKVAACMACHGPSGAGNPGAKFPSLSGQHAPYVSKALKDFRSGSRSNDPSNMMRDIAIKMTDPEIEAVAEYITGLH